MSEPIVCRSAIGTVSKVGGGWLWKAMAGLAFLRFERQQQQPAVDIWLTLYFDFNLDYRKAQPSMSATTTPAEIEASLPPPRFSICVIAKDEEETLPGLAKSLEFFLQHGGEVVLLDTGSTDGTVKLAEKLGFRAFANKGRFEARLNKMQARKLNDRVCDPRDGTIFTAGQSSFHFSEARNACTQLATHDMVLCLDASDRVDALDFGYINDAIEAGYNSFYYELALKEGSGTSSLLTAHRFYNRRIEDWQGTTHEALYSRGKKEALEAHKMALQRGSLHVVHERQPGRAPRDPYMTGLAIDAVSHPNNALVAHNFGRALLYADKPQSALKVLEKHLTMEFAEQSLRALSACFIGQIWEGIGERIQAEARARFEKAQRSGGALDDQEVAGVAARVMSNYDKAREAYFKAFHFDCGFRSPLIGLSGLALKARDGQRALIWAKAAKHIQRDSIATENSAHYTYKIDELLFRAYYVLWRDATQEKRSPTYKADLWNRGRAHWQRCQEMAPELRTVKNFAEVYDMDEMIAASGQHESSE